MTLTSSLDTRIRRIGARCFVLVGVTCALVLPAWRLGLAQVGVLDVAPVTLVLLMLLSLAAWLCQRPSISEWANRLGLVIGLGALVINILVCTRFLFKYDFGGEAWLTNLLVVAKEGVRVRMSKTAAFCFVLCCLAWLFQCRPCFQHRAPRQVAALLASAVLILGLVMLLCYLLQSAYYAHMAFLAAVGLLLLGLGLLLTAGLDNWPLNLCFLPSDQAPSRRRFVWGMVSLALLLVVLVAATGQFYFNSQQVMARHTAWDALSTVADLKVAQIRDWRNERLADAGYLRRTPYVARRALDVLKHPHSQATEDMFRDWLQSLLLNKSVEQILLLDEQFNLRLTHPAQALGKVTDALRRAAEQASNTKTVVVADLERPTENGPVLLSFLVPLVVRRVGNIDRVVANDSRILPKDRSKGVLVLQVDAHKTLYPLLKLWPTPSPTAEELLVRQDGTDALFLNELRHCTNSVLTLRAPLNSPILASRAVRGLGGNNGVMVGPDYRGVMALGVGRKIPNTPWVLVAKVDQAEVFSPLLRQAWTTAAFVGLLTGAAMLGVGLLGRQRHLISIRRELLLERQHTEAENKFRTLFESSRDAIILLAHEQFIDCNQAALDLFGCESRDQLIAKHPSEVSPPKQRNGMDSRIAARERIEAANAQGTQFFEWLHQRMDGAVFPAEVLLSRIELGGNVVLQAVVRDITERKRAETALLEISDREQARIGQDLHDGLCQHLVATAFAANSLERKLATQNASESADVQKLASMLDEAITQARNTARGLYPVQLEDEGLALALQELAARIDSRPALVCKMDYPAPVYIRDNATATQLYRIAQEAVNNAVKHASPKEIVLRLTRHDEQIELAVLDNGIGIPDPMQSNGGMGVNIMEYRAKTIGGAFAIRRQPEGGTLVSCSVREKHASDERQARENGA